MILGAGMDAGQVRGWPVRARVTRHPKHPTNDADREPVSTHTGYLNC
jgi:hypothetical protein